MKRLCSISGCENPHRSRGWCGAHYSRWRALGDPLAGGPMRILGDPERRFWAKVDKSGGCWVWTGACNSDGYGNFLFEGANWRAHRWSYERLVGPIPDGLVIDHLCCVTRCVNPAHLEPVTHLENVRRGIRRVARAAELTNEQVAVV